MRAHAARRARDVAARASAGAQRRRRAWVACAERDAGRLERRREPGRRACARSGRGCGRRSASSALARAPTRRPRGGRWPPARSARPSPRRAARAQRSVSSQYRKKSSSRPPTALERLAPDQHAGAGDPVGRAGRGRRRRGSRISSSVQAACGQSRCRNRACAKVERRRGKRRWLCASAPSSSRIRGPAMPAAGSASSTADERRRGVGASMPRVGVEQEHVRRGAARGRRGCSRPRSRRCAARARARASGGRRRGSASRRARRCRRRSTWTPGMAASGSTQPRRVRGAVVGDDDRVDARHQGKSVLHADDGRTERRRACLTDRPGWVLRPGPRP